MTSCAVGNGGGGEEHDDVAGEMIDGGPPRVAVTMERNSVIETVVTFVQAIYQGRGMTVEEYRRYYIPEFPWCERLR